MKTIYTAELADSIFETKDAHDRDISAIKDQLQSLAQSYSIYGMGRVNGETSPNACIFFGEESNFKQIANVTRMGLVGYDGKLYKRCMNCRIDMASDGTELRIDGSDGDVLMYTDRSVYVCRFTDKVNVSDITHGNETHNGEVELNVFAIGLAPFEIYGHAAKEIKPFALTPQMTVSAKLTATNNEGKVEETRFSF